MMLMPNTPAPIRAANFITPMNSRYRRFPILYAPRITNVTATPRYHPTARAANAASFNRTLRSDSVRLNSGPARGWGNRLWVFLVIAACLGVVTGCDDAKRPPPPRPPASVTVARPAVERVMNWDEYQGLLSAVQLVDLRARVSGMITSVPFPEGAVVSAGDVLVEIDARPFEADLEKAIADEARAAANVDLAMIEFKRLDDLSPNARSQAEYDTAAANLKAARSARDAAGAAIDLARLQVEWCKVRAPISGRISRKYVTAGNLITGGGGEQSTLLTTIASVDPIYCDIFADEQSVLKYMRMARDGERVSARDARIPCYLGLSDEAGFPHEGSIDFVDNRLDPSTGTIRARGIFSNSSGVLLPGLFARVRVPGRGPYQALLVPDAAVVSDQGTKLLMIVGDDGIVKARAVALGTQFGLLRVIDSGLQPTDRVVIGGIMSAHPGAKVNAVEATFPVDVAALTKPGGPPSGSTAPASVPASVPVSRPVEAHEAP